MKESVILGLETGDGQIHRKVPRCNGGSYGVEFQRVRTRTAASECSPWQLATLFCSRSALLLSLGVPPPLVLLHHWRGGDDRRGLSTLVEDPPQSRSARRSRETDRAFAICVQIVGDCFSGGCGGRLGGFCRKRRAHGELVWVVMLSVFSAACFLFSVYVQRKALVIGGDERALVPQERGGP